MMMPAKYKLIDPLWGSEFAQSSFVLHWRAEDMVAKNCTLKKSQRRRRKSQMFGA